MFAEQRKPCPRCGNNGGRDLRVEVVDGVGIREDVVADSSGPGGRGAIRVERTGEDARSAAADLDETGRVGDRIVGRASAKADAELRAASRFVERLNRDGAQWGALIVVNARAPDETGVDCVAENDDGEQLMMQVTSSEGEAWRRLAHEPEVVRQLEHIEPVLEALRATISSKSVLDGRGGITLLIDATDSPRASLRSVASEFQRRHGRWARECKWQAIWLVGPVVELVHRLDVD
jgi:hypothetical protein